MMLSTALVIGDLDELVKHAVDDPSMTGAKAWQIIEQLMDNAPRRKVLGTNYNKANSDLLYEAVEFVRVHFHITVFEELDDILWSKGYHRHSPRGPQ